MRIFSAIVAVLLASSGCTAYVKSQNRTKSARREAMDIAIGGVAQLLVGGLITVGSHYWFNQTKRDPEPLQDNELSASAGAVAGLLLGSGIVIGGVADGTIGLYQSMSNDYLFGSPPPPGPPTAPGSNDVTDPSRCPIAPRSP